MADRSDAPRIVLVGMMGCGKSTVGRALAQRTGWRYLDNDELVRAVSGRESEHIDARDGEETLHVVEAAAFRHALAEPPPVIVGAAASVVADPSSVALLRAQPLVVYLRAQPETLRPRIGSGSGRRRDATDLAWLHERFRERDDLYRDMALLTIDTDALEPAAVAERITARLGLQAAPAT